MNKIKNYLDHLNVTKTIEISVHDLVFDEEVRHKCFENKCSGFKKNFMCPPMNGSIEDNKNEILKFEKGFLIFVVDELVSHHDIQKCYETADKLHDVILLTEAAVLSSNYNEVMGFIAGHCRLCDPCGVVFNMKNCIRPMESRPSLEAVGIDVIKTCLKVGEPLNFKSEGVTWVGMILIK